MEKEVQGSLTRGPIFRVLMKLALPIMASAFLSTAYNIVDMFWIGKLGSAAVAGVGIGGQFVWFSSGIACLPKMGGQIHVGQSLGRGDWEKARHYCVAAIHMVVYFALVFGVAFLFFTEQLVGIFHLTDSETIHYAHQYCRIVCGLILFSFLNSVLIGLYTAQGDSKTPLQANVIGLVLNMILDPLFIFGAGPIPGWDVVGAAVATVFSQFVSMMILILFAVLRKKQDNLLRGLRILCRPQREYLLPVLKMGWPTALQSLSYSGISIILTRVIAVFGSGAIAAQRIGEQLEALSWNAADGFAAAINAFVAQNFGAGKMDRVRKGYRTAFVVVAFGGVLVMLLFLLLPEQIAGLFFYEEDIIQIAVHYLIILSFSQAFMCVELMATGAICGLGCTKACSAVSVAFTVMRIPLAIILSSTALGLEGIWWTLTITTVCKGVGLHLLFCYQSKKKQRISRDAIQGKNNSDKHR